MKSKFIQAFWFLLFYFQLSLVACTKFHSFKLPHHHHILRHQQSRSRNPGALSAEQEWISRTGFPSSSDEEEFDTESDNDDASKIEKRPYWHSFKGVSDADLGRMDVWKAFGEHPPPRPPTRGITVRIRQKAVTESTRLLLTMLFERDQWATIARFVIPQHLVVYENSMLKVALVNAKINKLEKPPHFNVNLQDSGVFVDARGLSFDFQSDVEVFFGKWKYRLGQYRVKCESVNFQSHFMPQIVLVDDAEVGSQQSRRLVVHVVNPNLEYIDDLDVELSNMGYIMGPLQSSINFLYRTINYFFKHDLRIQMQTRTVSFLQEKIPKLTLQYAYTLIGSVLGVIDNFFKGYYDVDMDLKSNFEIIEPGLDVNHNLVTIRSNIILKQFLAKEPTVEEQRGEWKKFFVSEAPKRWNLGVDRQQRVDIMADPPTLKRWYSRNRDRKKKAKKQKEILQDADGDVFHDSREHFGTKERMSGWWRKFSGWFRK